MSNINLDWYRTFLVVADSKSLNDASNKLNIATSGISKTIKKIEETLGTTLFYRYKDGMKLTTFGKELYDYVDKGIATLDLGEKLVLQNCSISSSYMIIGCPSHILSFYLMDSINNMKNDYKDIKIKVIAGSNGNELLNLLEDHKIDFIVDGTNLDMEYNNIEIKKIREMENIFVSKEKIEIKNLKELENYKFILPFDYSKTRKNLIECLKKEGIQIKANLEIDITESRIDAAKRNMGIAYLMKAAVKNELNKKELYELKLPINLPKTVLNLIYRKGELTKANKEFIKKYMNVKI